MKVDRETSVRIASYFHDIHEFTVTITGEPLSVVKVLARLGELQLIEYHAPDWNPQSFDKKVNP